MITQTFDLNLIPDSSPVVVHCDQYDKGTGRLVISLYDGSIAYSPSGTAVIQGTKPDGHGFDYACTMSGNVVTADLTEQMTAVAGQVRTQIVVTESTGRTGTFVFILDVQRSALPSDTDMSESDYQLIEQAIEDAQQAVTDAEGYSEDSEAWAVGERGGVPVTSGDDTYHNNSKYWADIASQYAQGGLHYEGSCTFANIPTTGMTDGDMWNIEDDFTTDSRFREGAGVSVVAGTNIAWISSISKWDVLAVSKSGVQSFNGRTGIVTPQSGDYDLTDMGDVNISSATNGQGLVYDSVSGKWVNGNVAVSDMTLSTKGIGKPDGITTDVNNGTFSAVGVSIPADVNSSGTQYGSNWLYYAGTSDVITPSTKQNYRVNDNGTMKLYYWTGSAYSELTSGGGGGGGMNTDGSNAASTVGMSGTKVFTIGDRTGKSATGEEAIELGSGANATGYGAIAEGAKSYGVTNTNTTLAANTTTETLATAISQSTSPYQAFSLRGPACYRDNIDLAIEGSLSEDKYIISGNVTVRLTQNDTSTRVYYTNTGNTNVTLYFTFLSHQNIASKDNAHVEGAGNTASGACSHAEGATTNASGDSSHAEGADTQASSKGSHAEGRFTSASGDSSHAEGYYTKASEARAHAEGYFTKASSADQHVSGRYNVADTSSTYAVIVGNGTADNARSNAMTLDWSGNLVLAGDITNGSNQTLSGVNTAQTNKHKVTSKSVATTGWTSDTTSQSGTTLYKKTIALSHVYVDAGAVEVSIGASGVLPTVAQQEAFDLLQYTTINGTTLTLYASAVPTTAFYINVEGAD